MNPTDSLGQQFGGARRNALLIGAAGAALCLFAATSGWTQFLHSYLVAYLFWLEIALGCLGILMLHHLVGGNWGFAIRRLLEAGASTLPLMGALFVPLLLGHARLYKVPPSAGFKSIYLSMPFFFGRAVFYFALWSVLSYLLLRWSSEQDRTANPDLVPRFQKLSGPGLLLYGFTVSFASIDWAMSLEPGFSSTIYGVLFMIVGPLLALALTIVVMAWVAGRPPLSETLTPLHFHDHGNLLLTFVMLWAYLSFSQFIIIWMGNLREEIPWYTVRARGGWGQMAACLIVLHFALPFLLLLHRSIKRRVQVLATVAALLFCAGWIDLFWIIAPSFDATGPHIHWVDLIAPVALGGFWAALFLGQLGSRPLLPLHDPRFESKLEGATAHE